MINPCGEIPLGKTEQVMPWVQEELMKSFRGPTVHEMAGRRIKAIDKLMSDLRDERAACEVRLRTQKYANMYEAERIATQAEPFQIGVLKDD